MTNHTPWCTGTRPLGRSIPSRNTSPPKPRRRQKSAWWGEEGARTRAQTVSQACVARHARSGTGCTSPGVLRRVLCRGITPPTHHCTANVPLSPLPHIISIHHTAVGAGRLDMSRHDQGSLAARLLQPVHLGSQCTHTAVHPRPSITSTGDPPSVAVSMKSSGSCILCRPQGGAVCTRGQGAGEARETRDGTQHGWCEPAAARRLQVRVRLPSTGVGRAQPSLPHEGSARRGAVLQLAARTHGLLRWHQHSSRAPELFHERCGEARGRASPPRRRAPPMISPQQSPACHDGVRPSHTPHLGAHPAVPDAPRVEVHPAAAGTAVRHAPAAVGVRVCALEQQGHKRQHGCRARGSSGTWVVLWCVCGADPGRLFAKGRLPWMPVIWRQARRTTHNRTAISVVLQPRRGRFRG